MCPPSPDNRTKMWPLFSQLVGSRLWNRRVTVHAATVGNAQRWFVARIAIGIQGCAGVEVRVRYRFQNIPIGPGRIIVGVLRVSENDLGSLDLPSLNQTIAQIQQVPFE